MGIWFLFVIVASLMTHIARCIQIGDWNLLIGGLMIFPVGIVHGIGRWFGLF